MRDTAEGEDDQRRSNGAARAQQSPIPLAEPQQQKQQHTGPNDKQDDYRAFNKIEGEEGLGALDEVGRDNDGSEKAHPRIESRAFCQGEDDEEQQAHQQDVGDLRVTDAGNGLRGVHTYVCAATEQVAIVADRDERRESDALADSLQHPMIFSKRSRTRPFSSSCLSSM